LAALAPHPEPTNLSRRMRLGMQAMYQGVKTE
jgi:hypothetical protein